MGFDITVVYSKEDARPVEQKVTTGFGSYESHDIPLYSRGCGSMQLEYFVKDFIQPFSIDFNAPILSGQDLLDFAYAVNTCTWSGYHSREMDDMYFFNMYKWVLIQMADTAYEKGWAIEFS